MTIMTLIVTFAGAYTLAAAFMRFVEYLEKGQKKNRPTDRNSRPACYTSKRSTYEN